MNKYVLRISLVWLAIFAAAVGFLLYRTEAMRTRFEPHTASSAQMLPEASGPPANAAAQASTDSRSVAMQSAAPALAAVQLTPERMQSIGVQVGEVVLKQVSDDILATGNVDIDERLVSYVQVRFTGYLRKVFANVIYQYVRAGEPLFTVYSPDLVATEQELLLARQNQRVLGSSTVGGVAAGAEALAAAAEQRLRQWEIPQRELDKLKASGQPVTDITIDSPVSGYITERNALPNMYVEPSTRLYAIADLSRVWVYAQVFQDQVGRLKPGDAARITVDSYPGQVFASRVEEVLPQVDPATQTVRVRLAVANAGLRLKPGMFVNVELKAGMGRALTVPATAVLQSGTRQIVFLDLGNGRLQPKEVTVGARAGDEFIVLRGLTAHQKVVTSANFLIDSESQLQAAAGSFLPPPGGGGSAQGEGPKGPQPMVELSTDPNPAQRGNNVFHVTVKDTHGTFISGAEVTATFYMPAMASMGMAAMNMTTRLTERANGMYEGSGRLDSGGTWQVTVTVEKGGQILALRQLRVSATGGM